MRHRCYLPSGFSTPLVLAAVAVAALSSLSLFKPNGTVERPKLSLQHVGSDSTAFHVIATLVIGPTEVLLWDAQYHVTDAKRVADHVQATGKRLKAIVLSHADHDHFTGAAAIVETFPGTPVYLTEAALQDFNARAKNDFNAEKTRRAELFPDSLVTPKVLPSLTLDVDGEQVVIIPDLAGDVIPATNSVLWIPSLRAALVGDIAFQAVHPWLGNSDESSRKAWRASLKRIADLKPSIVVAGHKNDITAADSPDVLREMDGYLAAFDSLRHVYKSGAELYNAMIAKYPNHSVGVLVRFAAMNAYKK